MTELPHRLRLAVLIDADNVSADHAANIMIEIANHGSATVKRAYGDWTTNRLAKWKDELNRYAIQPLQQFAYTTGKNSTDSALIIDAMDLLYAGNVEGFVLVSSDSDFTRLATRLRESGKIVYGLGRSSTPQAFTEACDRFIFLEVLATPPADQPASDPPSQTFPDLQQILTQAVRATSQDNGWSSLSAVGTHLANSHASFDPRNYGYPKLVELARAQNFVDVEQDGNRPVRIRLRSSRPARTATARKSKSPGKQGSADAQTNG
jgi:hypothetical protein